MTRSHSRFSLSNVLTDPFLLTTISLAGMSWVLTLGACIAYSQEKDVLFPKFTWWSCVFEFLLIVTMFLLCCMDLIRYYRTLICTACGIGLVYASNSANNTIWSVTSLSQVASATGCVLLSIINVIWLIYFGGDSDSPTNQFVDSFGLGSTSRNALNRGSRGNLDMYHRESLGMFIGPTDSLREMNLANRRSMSQGPRGPMRQDKYFQDTNLRNSQLARGDTQVSGASGAYLASNQLTGLENFSERDEREEEIRGDVGDNSHFKYKARALYLYEANPNDENELSFSKGEILRVDDITGKWWQAQRETGEIGICPSNYVELLD